MENDERRELNGKIIDLTLELEASIDREKRLHDINQQLQQQLIEKN